MHLLNSNTYQRARGAVCLPCLPVCIHQMQVCEAQREECVCAGGERIMSGSSVGGLPASRGEVKWISSLIHFSWLFSFQICSPCTYDWRVDSLLSLSIFWGLCVCLLMWWGDWWRQGWVKVEACCFSSSSNDYLTTWLAKMMLICWWYLFF